MAAKNGSTFAKQGQNAKVEMSLAMEPSPEWSVNGVRTAATNQPSQKPRNLRRVAAKNGSTFAKQAQNANVEMHLAMEPSPEWSVSGVRTAATNQPSQKGGKTRRVAAKNGSTFAKQAQNAKVEMSLAMKPPPEGSVNGVRTAATNQPSQKHRNLRRVAAKKTAQPSQNRPKTRRFPQIEHWLFF